MLLNQSRYCAFSRSGDGYQNADRFNCRITNSSHRIPWLSADSLLESELTICDPAVWPSVRNPADQLRADLRAANRAYRAALRSARFPSELREARDAYRVARANLRTWLRSEHAPETYGVFFSCYGTEVRSQNPGAGLDFDSYADAAKCASRQQEESATSCKYYVRELP